MRIHNVLAMAVLAILATEAAAQTGAPAPTQTLASLLKDGYEMQDGRLFKDKIWMRKPGSGDANAFICDRGRLGSPNFEAYRARKYDEIPCSPAPP